MRTTNFVTVVEIVLHYSFFDDIQTKQDVNNPLCFFSMLIKPNLIEDNMAQKTISDFFQGGYYFTIICQNKDQCLVSSFM